MITDVIGVCGPANFRIQDWSLKFSFARFTDISKEELTIVGWQYSFQGRTATVTPLVVVRIKDISVICWASHIH